MPFDEYIFTSRTVRIFELVSKNVADVDVSDAHLPRHFMGFLKNLDRGGASVSA
jgi:hypothetical protein